MGSSKLCTYQDAERQRLSDFTCTALQLTNSWQDVSEDYEKGRVYLPQADMRRFGVTEGMIGAREPKDEMRELIRFQVERTRELFRQGLPLIGQVRRELARDLDLFTRGGMEVLRAIEESGYDVMTRRPMLSKNRPRRRGYDSACSHLRSAAEVWDWRCALLRV